MGQNDDTPLQVAAMHNSLGVAQLLLRAGASADVKDKVRARST